MFEVPRIRGAIALAVLALACAPLVPSMAARPVAPPSVELTRGENNVVVATVLDKLDATHFVVQMEDVLSGSGEGEETLRGDPTLVGQLHLGQRYVIAFSRLTSDEQFRDAKYLDPEGPRVLKLRGHQVGTAFADSKGLRFLFQRARGVDNQPTDRERLDAILELIRTGDERLLAFAIEELYLRNELPPIMSVSDTRELAALARDADLHLQLRQFLAEATLSVPGRAEQPWLLDMDRALLSSVRPQLDLATARPKLVTTAIAGIAANGSVEDLPLLLRMLESNSPGVVTDALEAADRFDSAATYERVSQLLNRWTLKDDVPRDARRAVEAYFISGQVSRQGNPGR